MFSKAAQVGLTPTDAGSDDLVACQRVGGAAAWLGRGSLIVPSARVFGDNLIVLVGPDGSDIDVVSSEEIDNRAQ